MKKIYSLLASALVITGFGANAQTATEIALEKPAKTPQLPLIEKVVTSKTDAPLRAESDGTDAPESIVGKSFVTIFNEGGSQCNGVMEITQDTESPDSLLIYGLTYTYTVKGSYDASTGTLTIPANGKVIGQFSSYGDVSMYAEYNGSLYTAPITATWTDGKFVFDWGIYARCSAGYLVYETDITATEPNGWLNATISTNSGQSALALPLLVKKTATDKISVVGISAFLYGTYYEVPISLDETAQTALIEFGTACDYYSSYSRTYVLGGVGEYLEDLPFNVTTTDDSSTLTGTETMFYGYNTSGTSYSGYYIYSPVFTVDFNVFTAEPEIEPVDPSKPIIDGIHYESDLDNKTTEVIGCDDSLTELNIPATIEVEGETYTVISVCEGAFNGNKNITSITVPSTIQTVETDAFRNVTNLKKLYISDLESWIDIEFANGNANPIYNVFPSNTANWGKVYIGGEEVSTSLVIPEGISTIGRSFYGFKSLTSISLPESLEVIGNQAFTNCIGLTEVSIPAAVTEMGSSFFGCSALKTVNFSGNNLKKLTGSTFYNCAIDTITLPANLETIGAMTFSGCKNLTGITLPETVTTIGAMAFSGTALNSIVSYATVPPTAESWAFDDVDTSIPVYVPTESIDAYKAATEWENFTNYVGSDFSGVKELLDNATGENAVYYNLQGVRVENPENGVYIVRQGSKNTKVIIK